MRFGKWRGMALAVAMATTLGLGLGLASSARADGFLCPHVLPGVVPAYDFTTGGEYHAPPIPYGHYAKDYVAEAQKCLGCLTGPVHGLLGQCCAICGKFHGSGDGMCQGGMCAGGDGHGGCAGPGCSSGHGPFDPAGGSACIVPGCSGGPGCGHQSFAQAGVGTAVVGGGTAGVGAVAGVGVGAGTGTIAPVIASPQLQYGAAAIADPGKHSVCGLPGCTFAFNHTHPGFGNGGNGGIPGGVPQAYGGPGYGDPGAGTGCGFCGGKGCGKCLGLLHHLKLPHIGIPHHPKLTYFVGPGGPVPLTPGYVPYIVATRSPRDYFAFPPRNPNDP